MGRGFWGPGYGMGLGYGWPGGRGNPYPFCRFFPWLPRGWWRSGIYGPMTPYSYAPYGTLSPYPSYRPYSAGYARPYYY
ncbi:MAG: hypothetical protein ACUVRH_02095 [Candidatus Bipolaricaulia bacterium]